MVFVLDNYDSFTYNLVQYLGELGARPMVRRNDQVTLDEIAGLAPSHIVISPGPGRPEDAGVTVDVIRRFGPTTPLLGVCLGHQAIGMAYGGSVVRAPAPLHGKTSAVEHDGRGVFAGLGIAVPGRPVPFAGGRRRGAAAVARSVGAHAARRHHHGPAASRVPRARRPVPPRVGVDRRRPAAVAQFPEPAPIGRAPFSCGGRALALHSRVLTDLLHKLTRHEDLTAEQAAGAMDLVMTGQATPAQLAGLLVGLSMKGERPEEIVGLAQTMRAHAVPLSRRRGRGLRHVRHRRRSRRHDQRLDGRRAGAGRCGRSRRQARQPLGLEPLRQRRRVRGAGRRHHRAARGGRTQPRRGRRRVSLRAVVSSGDEARGAHAQGTGPAHRVQPARSAHESGRARRARSSACPGPS